MNLRASLPHAHQPLHNPFRRLPIPQLRHASFFPGAVHNSGEGGGDGGRVGADQFVGAYRAGFGAFGAVAQGKTRHTHDGGLFSDASRVGDDAAGMLDEVVKFQITQRLGQNQAFRADAKGDHILAGAGMNGKNDRKTCALHGLQDADQLVTGVDVGRTMQRHDEIFPWCEAVFIPERRLTEAVHVLV